MTKDNHLNYGIVRKDGLVYQGYLVHGKRQGDGRMCDSIGNIYIGTWKNDTLIRGTRIDTLGNRYTGKFNSNLQPHGYGTYQSRDGGFYEGNWSNGQRNGFGIGLAAHSELKVGEWHHNHYRGERLIILMSVFMV